MKSVLVLVPPNISSMDSAAGGRFQATYNASGYNSSHWIPLWICYAAAASSNIRCLDCNIEGWDRSEFLRRAPEYDIYCLYSNQETLFHDIKTAQELAILHTGSQMAFSGPYATVKSEAILKEFPEAIVIRGEIEQPIRELVNGADYRDVQGIAWAQDGAVVLNGEPRVLDDLDSLNWASKIIRRDLPLLKYRIPYLYHPYISIFTGRGCRHRCIFCLWPQTISGHRYRKRSIKDVYEEMRWISAAMPEIREIQIEDDTFTDDPQRVFELCELLKGTHITWSCCARQDVAKETLIAMKRAGARNIVVGFESGDDEILKACKKGVTRAQGLAFMENCRSVGLSVHGCFVFGLPGETEETMERTLNYAMELNPDSVQFTIACSYEGTEFNDYLRSNEYLADNQGITEQGHISARYSYPGLSSQRINQFNHEAWKRYYIRPAPIIRQLKNSLTSVNESKKLFHGVKYLGDYFFMKAPHNRRA